MRLDRPIGTYLLLWPTLWALWFASEGHPQLSHLIIFTLGVVVMRAAGCVINDYADRHVDGSVERTKNRPIPAGEVSASAALKLFFGLMAGSTWIGAANQPADHYSGLWRRCGGCTLSLFKALYPSAPAGFGYRLGLVNTDGICRRNQWLTA